MLRVTVGRKLKKPWAFTGALFLNPYMLGVWEPGLLRQVATLECPFAEDPGPRGKKNPWV